MLARVTTILSAVVCGLTIAVHAADHTTDALSTVQQKLKARQAVLLDVREQSEWDAGHLAEAQLQPLSRLKAGLKPEDLQGLPKDKPIYLHCRSGKRVLVAAEILAPLGYDVRPLKAGYDDLIQAGFPKAPAP